jgi:hypothetical protein
MSEVKKKQLEEKQVITFDDRLRVVYTSLLVMQLEVRMKTFDFRKSKRLLLDYISLETESIKNYSQNNF